MNSIARRNICFPLLLRVAAKFVTPDLGEQLMRAKYIRERRARTARTVGVRIAWSLLRGPVKKCWIFNSRSHRLTSVAFRRLIKTDLPPLSLAEGTQKARMERCSGTLKSAKMMESVSSVNDSCSPYCLLCFNGGRSPATESPLNSDCLSARLFPPPPPLLSKVCVEKMRNVLMGGARSRSLQAAVALYEKHGRMSLQGRFWRHTPVESFWGQRGRVHLFSRIVACRRDSSRLCYGC